MELTSIGKDFQHVFTELGKVIVGQEEMLKQVLVAILCDGNVLLESVPGLGKTLTVKTFADILELKFSRIQNTPDLMPSDITGTYVLEEVDGKRNFKFQQGPIFANIVLADEINRATPKTQAALLEAMQEKQVTVGNKTFPLEYPFFILATQNPIEQEGTYPLPEAQQDRFLLKIKINYPTFDEELIVVDRFTDQIRDKDTEIKRLVKKEHIAKLQRYTREMPIANDLKKYAVKIVTSTRDKKDLIEYGASPRASIGLVMASKAKALIEGRKHVSKEDIKAMAYPVLRHRIILNFEAQRQNLSEDDVISKLL